MISMSAAMASKKISYELVETQVERMYAEDNEKKANLMDAVLELRLWIESCKEKEFLRELKDRGSEINTMEDFLDVVRRSM